MERDTGTEAEKSAEVGYCPGDGMAAGLRGNEGPELPLLGRYAIWSAAKQAAGRLPRVHGLSHHSSAMDASDVDKLDEIQTP